MNLTQIARLTKIGFLFISCSLFLTTIGWYGYRFWYTNYYLPSLPKEVVKPDVKFGILPKPLFPYSTVSSSNYSYSIDTKTGELPNNFPTQTKVFFVPQLGTTLLAPNKARDLAQSLNYTIGPEVITPTIYKFKDSEGGELVIDLETTNFNLKHEVASSSATQTFVGLPSEEQLSSDLKNFLSQRTLLKDSLQKGRTKVIFDKNTPQESSSAAVSIWPSDIEDLPIVTSSYSSGLVKATISKVNRNSEKYTKMDYIYWEPDFQNSSTYPIKTANQALNDLKGGKGVILQESKTPKASITSMYLAYYESDIYAPYIQPIYVFEGDELVAYVSAITDQYLEQN